MTRKEAAEILRDTPIDLRSTREDDIHTLYATAQMMAIDALQERPKGRWEFVELKGHPLYGKPHKVGEWRCPFCGRTVAFKPPYCHCGADMRGEEE